MATWVPWIQPLHRASQSCCKIWIHKTNFILLPFTGIKQYKHEWIKIRAAMYYIRCGRCAVDKPRSSPEASGVSHGLKMLILLKPKHRAIKLIKSREWINQNQQLFKLKLFFLIGYRKIFLTIQKDAWSPRVYLNMLCVKIGTNDKYILYRFGISKVSPVSLIKLFVFFFVFIVLLTC